MSFADSILWISLVQFIPVELPVSIKPGQCPFRDSRFTEPSSSAELFLTSFAPHPPEFSPERK